MKFSKVYLLLFFAGLFLACSSDSDDDNSTPTETSRPIDKSANLLATGESANDILSNTNFDKLIVEIAYVTGFRPTQTAMDELETFVRMHTFKNNIELVFTELPSPDEETLTIREVADLENDNRTQYNSDNTLAIYIYFTDAPSDGDDEEEGTVTLGAVYRNTSMVIYEETVRRLARLSNFISNADVETATINHEFGHLFGLVNLGTPAINDHEDEEAKNHCNVPGCLMRAQLQFGGGAATSKAATENAEDELKAACNLSNHSVLQMLANRTSTGAVNTVPLDPECVLDLQSNGGR